MLFYSKDEIQPLFELFQEIIVCWVAYSVQLIECKELAHPRSLLKCLDCLSFVTDPDWCAFEKLDYENLWTNVSICVRELAFDDAFQLDPKKRLNAEYFLTRTMKQRAIYRYLKTPGVSVGSVS